MEWVVTRLSELVHFIISKINVNYALDEKEIVKNENTWSVSLIQDGGI